MKTKLTTLLMLVVLIAVSPAFAQTRLKDIAAVQGVRSNQLIGYGLVAGLDGTGDGTSSVMTPQSITSMLQKFGVTVATSQMRVKNVAAVMVTANLPAFVKNGSTIDVVVSSLGDAKSLQGGTLMPTELKALNGQVYAVAAGPLSVGGFSAGGAGGGVTQNHVTAGRIPAGALVEQEVPTTYAGASQNSISVTLNQPDFTTASRVASAIRKNLPEGAVTAHAVDGATVRVDYAPGADPISLIAGLEGLPIDTDQPARVVINERTGTVVMGGDVTVSACAVSQGDLTVEVKEVPVISQPLPKSQGQTVSTTDTDVKVKLSDTHLMAVPASITLDHVIRALNAIKGISPRDLISILQAMKEAGALHADIEVQ